MNIDDIYIRMNEALNEDVRELPVFISQKRIDEIKILFDNAVKDLPKYSLNLESVSNARDLGGIITSYGGIVKKNMLIRSGRLTALSDIDKAILEEMHISAVIDLRGHDEAESIKDREIKGVKHIILPLADSVTSEYANTLAYLIRKTEHSPQKAWMLSEYAKSIDMEDVYLMMIKEQGIKCLKELFRLLLDEKENTILFHCNSGKDRSGFVSALILYALGCSMEVIIEEYFMSNAALYERIKFYADDLYNYGYGMGAVLKLCEIVGVNDMNLKLLFSKIIEEHGNIDSFLEKELGIGEKEKKKLRNKYIEKK